MCGFPCRFLFSDARARYCMIISRHEIYGVILPESGPFFMILCFLMALFWYYPARYSFPYENIFRRICLVHSENPAERTVIMQVRILRHSGFFYFFWFIWPIRQIKNIFIPLFFHWRTGEKSSDSDIKLFNNFIYSVNRVFLNKGWSGNRGISLSNHSVRFSRER